MNTNEKAPETLVEAVKYFADLNVCHAYMTRVKWPDGRIVCPKCGGDQIGIIASRCMFQCKAKDCRKQFSSKVGTIFEDSPLGLDKWFVAVWCITNAKNGISSCELARALGVTQKSAWHMLHRIRLALDGGSFEKMSGTVEADEHFVGGVAKNMHEHDRRRKLIASGPTGKTIVAGLLERNSECSRVKTEVVETVRRKDVARFVRENVEQGSEVMTDALRSYRSLSDTYLHQFIDHEIAFVKGRVHTNGLENFWSLLARAIKGTYVCPEPFHLHAYVTEQAWRFNSRKLTDGERFHKALPGVVGKKLPYDVLTGKIAGSEMRA